MLLLGLRTTFRRSLVLPQKTQAFSREISSMLAGLTGKKEKEAEVAVDAREDPPNYKLVLGKSLHLECSHQSINIIPPIN
jgi:hypothetical protein